MKIKDGFKFGLGFWLSYDLYKTVTYVKNRLQKKYEKYVAKTNAAIEKNTHQRDSFPPCKNKIGFKIE